MVVYGVPMETNTNPTFTLRISTDRDGRPSYAEVTTFVSGSVRADDLTPEQAVALAATFPKALGLRASTCSTFDAEGSYTSGTVGGSANLTANGVNGGKNEAGIKRLRRWVKDVPGLVYRADSFATLDEALAAIDA